MIMTKRQRNYFTSYINQLNKRAVNLYDVYSKPSTTKKDIWKRITKQFGEKDAQGLTVITHTAFIFTAGFLYKQNEEIYFALYTPSCYETIPLNNLHVKWLKSRGIKWK